MAEIHNPHMADRQLKFFQVLSVLGTMHFNQGETDWSLMIIGILLKMNSLDNFQL